MKKWFIGGAIVTVLVVLVAINGLRGGGGGSSVGGGKVQDVEAKTVSAGAITSSITITGRVEEVNQDEVVTQTPVKILDVFVKNGSVVKKGDQLFKADMDDLNRELEQLKINYDIRLLTMEKLEKFSGTSSEKAMTLALELAKVNRDAAQRAYDVQAENLEKNQTLYDSGLLSESEFEGLKRAVVQARSQLTTATLSYEKSQTELASLRTQAKNTDGTKAIDLKIQQLNIDSLKMNIDNLEAKIKTIKDMTMATMDGVVTGLSVEPGDTATAVAPLAVIRDIETLKIVANIREYDISNIDVGQEVIIRGDAIGKEDKVTGTVTYIAPIATKSLVNNRQVTAVDVEINVTEGMAYIKPGYTTENEIITSKLEDVVIATYEMLQKDSDGNDIVFVVTDGVAEERQVTLGATSDFDAEVTSGLEAGEMVVLNPSLSLFDGTKVRVKTEEEGR